MHIFRNTNFDFLRWRWHAIALSALIIVAGIVVVATRGLPLGIEFAGGTSVIVQFEQAVSTEQVRTALTPTYPEAFERASSPRSSDCSSSWRSC